MSENVSRAPYSVRIYRCPFCYEVVKLGRDDCNCHTCGQPIDWDSVLVKLVEDDEVNVKEETNA